MDKRFFCLRHLNIWSRVGGSLEQFRGVFLLKEVHRWELPLKFQKPLALPVCFICMVDEGKWSPKGVALNTKQWLCWSRCDLVGLEVWSLLLRQALKSHVSLSPVQCLRPLSCCLNSRCKTLSSYSSTMSACMSSIMDWNFWIVSLPINCFPL